MGQNADMFSVPGWNLSATVATQVEKPKAPNPNKEGKKAKKRRQKQEEEQIDDQNVGEYWAKIVQGAPPDNTEQRQIVKDVDAPAEEGAQEKKGKKRKRKGHAESMKDSKASVEDVKEGAQTAAAHANAARISDPKPDKKKRKRDAKSDRNAEQSTEITVPASADIVSLLPPEPKGLTPLQKSMRQKLAGARFRHLNETLYTKPSAESLSLFKQDPSMFEDYHRGFAQQTENWPENPVDVYVAAILTRGKARLPRGGKDKRWKEKRGHALHDVDTAPVSAEPATKPLPRNLKGHCTIADLGCGTASLAYRLQPSLKPLNLTLHSFDLSKPSGPSAPLVTIADISALPVPDATVDVAIFCLALMGTNWLDFIDEAYRILRWRGELWVAEIKSRFGRVERQKPGKPPINSIGSLRKGVGGSKPLRQKAGRRGEEEKEEGAGDGEMASDDEAELAQRVDGVEASTGTDVGAFVDVLYKHGFVLDAPPEHASTAIDLSNKMFVKMQFVKAAQPARGKNVRASQGDGKGALKLGIKGKKFTAITGDEADGDENDTKVLKPCLYKIR